MDYSQCEERIIYRKGVQDPQDVDIGVGRFRWYFDYVSEANAKAALLTAKLNPAYQTFWNLYRLGPDKDKYPGEGNWAYFEIPASSAPWIPHRERALEPRVEGKYIVVEVDMLEAASPVAVIVLVLCVALGLVLLAIVLSKVTELVVKSGSPKIAEGLGGLLDSLKQMVDKAPAIMIPLLAIAGVLLLMLLLPKSVTAARRAFEKS
jgi:hypothetical protein